MEQARQQLRRARSPVAPNKHDDVWIFRTDAGDDLGQGGLLRGQCGDGTGTSLQIGRRATHLSAGRRVDQPFASGSSSTGSSRK